MREIVLIAHAESRHGAEDYARARDALAARGANVVEAHLAKDRRKMCKLVRNAIKADHKYIAIAGGDGALTAVVGYFAHKDAVLGVIPAGTGNSFALTLGIGDDFDRAIEAIALGPTAKVDLGVINKTYFANFATIGLTAEIGTSTPRLLKAVLGTVAYAVGSIKPILTQRHFLCRVKWGKNRLDLETYQVIVANGRFYGHQPVIPEATITDGLLAFFATADTSRLDLAQMYLALVRGEQTHVKGAHYFQAPKLSIKTRPRQAVSIDGSYFGRTPLKLSVDARALNVCVPPGATEVAAR